MELILWRHAEAEVGEPDLGRRLTSKGEKQARRMAEWLHAHLPESARILVSPAMRAQQTVQALAELGHRKFKTVEEVAPGATVKDVLRAVDWPNAKKPDRGGRPSAYVCVRRKLPARGRRAAVVGQKGGRVVAILARTRRGGAGRAASGSESGSGVRGGSRIEDRVDHGAPSIEPEAVTRSSILNPSNSPHSTSSVNVVKSLCQSPRVFSGRR